MSTDTSPSLTVVPAVVRLVVESILWDKRLEDLLEVATEGHETAGVEGAPGWILERRNEADNHPYFANWPADARFRVYVDPGQYLLPDSECFLSRADFAVQVRQVLDEHLQSHPSDRAIVSKILDSLGR